MRVNTVDPVDDMMMIRRLVRISWLLLQFVLPVGTITASEQVRVLRTPGDGAVPDAQVGWDGAVHVAYVAGADVFYARSTNDGENFSAPLRVNSEPGTAHPPGMFRGPDLALGRDDTVHVIWYANSYQRQRPKEEWGVYYSRLAQASNGFAPARNLNHRPSDNYSLAADGRGNVAVFWMADGLYVNMSRDGGENFGPEEKVTLADTCECCASRAYFGADGTLFCAYRDKTDNQRDMYLLVRRSSVDVWTRAKVSGTPWLINGCPMTGTYLGNAHEGVVMGWETKGMISFARFDSEGRRQGKEIVVPGTGGKYPVVLAAPDGVTCVSWKKGSTLQWCLYGTDGQLLGEVVSQPSPNGHRHAGIVSKAGGFVLID